MTQPKKKPVTKAKKKKGRVVIKESVKVRPKGTKTAKIDTVPIQLPRSNSAVFRIKVKKK